jgi:2'-5' RNA ligase
MEIVTVNDNKEFIEHSRKFPYLTTYVGIDKKLQVPILEAQRELQIADPRQLYPQPSYFHITLKEIGSLGASVKVDTLPKIIKAVQTVSGRNASFPLKLNGVGMFSDVIYARVSEGADNIRKLHMSLAEGLGNLAVKGRYDGENMLPHLTLVQFSTKDVEQLLRKARQLENRPIVSMVVEKITLVKSFPYRFFGTAKEKDSVNEEITSFDLRRK